MSRLVELGVTPDGGSGPLMLDPREVVAVEPYVGGFEFGGIWRALEVSLSRGHRVTVMDTPENRRRLNA